MGCYTRHNLEIKLIENNNLIDLDTTEAYKIIEDLRNNCTSAYYAIDHCGINNQPTKWHESTKNLKTFSKNYPSYLFILSGEGEDTGDLWKTYFINGKHQISQAIITYPEFDINKFEV